jgi:hypothetical protein
VEGAAPGSAKDGVRRELYCSVITRATLLDPRPRARCVPVRRGRSGDSRGTAALTSLRTRSESRQVSGHPHTHSSKLVFYDPSVAALDCVIETPQAIEAATETLSHAPVQQLAGGIQRSVVGSGAPSPCPVSQVPDTFSGRLSDSLLMPHPPAWRVVPADAALSRTLATRSLEVPASRRSRRRGPVATGPLPFLTSGHLGADWAQRFLSNGSFIMRVQSLPELPTSVRPPDHARPQTGHATGQSRSVNLVATDTA